MIISIPERNLSVLALTADVDNTEYLPQVGNTVKVSVANSGGGHEEIVDGVAVGHKVLPGVAETIREKFLNFLKCAAGLLRPPPLAALKMHRMRLALIRLVSFLSPKYILEVGDSYRFRAQCKF